MLSLILGFITGLVGPIMNLVGQITDLKKAKIVADSDIQKKQIDASIFELEDKKSVIVAMAGTRIGAFCFAIPQFILGISISTYVAKLLLWDKVVGSFQGCTKGAPNNLLSECLIYNTDGLDANLWWIVLAGVGLYFVRKLK